MVPFAGYDLPVSYKDTITDSHKHVRSSAGLFDVSHMGQVLVHGPREDRLGFLETLCVGDLLGLNENQARLSVLTNERGGIIDDCIITNKADHTFVVVNGACKVNDLRHMREHLEGFNASKGTSVQIEYLDDTRSLMALQGPKAAEVMSRMCSYDLSTLPFMYVAHFQVAGFDCWVSRCGYTGEDGFEISVEDANAAALMAAILEHQEVRPVGLGARDTLRLEAGLCLYGHDLNEDTTPVQGGLLFTIGKRRRAEGGFLGADVILEQIKTKQYGRKRVGLVVEKGAPAREDAKILDENDKEIGVVTSGTVSPTLGSKIAMGYVDKTFMKSGTRVQVEVRGRKNPAVVAKMPFVPSNYYTPN